ncbi:MAG: TetR/AcrR family transcriptional regulator [Thermodesulfovibrionales bacterium]|nr:TetR/AcrR family transcriptional regulator [Thermodesulfovibrionales bacterium]
MTLESQSTKEKILQSALKLFSKKGYLGATTREIAKDAGVAEVTLFRHFTSKEKLLEGVLENYSFLPELKQKMPEILSLKYEEALHLIVKTFLKSLLTRKDTIKIIKSEILTHPDKISPFFQPFLRELYETLANYFVEMQRGGILKDFDPTLASRALLGMVFSYFEVEEFIFQREGSQESYEQILRDFVYIFARGTLK